MKKAIAKQIYEELENKILNNKIKDEPITELSVANMFNVSRTPAREALELLFANDLIYLDEDKNALFARKFTHKDYLDIFDIRIKIEGLSARLCALNVNVKTIEKLNENLLLQKFFLKTKNIDEICRLDLNFHQIICENCNNWFLTRIYKDFHRYTKNVRKMSYEFEERVEKSIKEHEEICNAICSKKPDLAEELASFHIMQAQKNIMI